MAARVALFVCKLMKEQRYNHDYFSSILNIQGIIAFSQHEHSSSIQHNSAFLAYEGVLRNILGQRKDLICLVRVVIHKLTMLIEYF